MNQKSRRRWWQFRLRTLLIAAALLALPLPWLGMQWNRMRQREQFIANTQNPFHPQIYCAPRVADYSRDPGLWLFGGRTASMIAVGNEEEEAEARRLFLEAHVFERQKP